MEANENGENPDLDIAGEWSDHFEKTIQLESTRAKAILSACYIDELLLQLISILLKPSEDKEDSLFDGARAPLGTLSAKIDLAYRMGAYDEKVWRSLHFVRKIRNKFAHRLVDCDFSDSQVSNWNVELHNLNDVATPERRKRFSPGPEGDFEKSTSWLVYWLKHVTSKIPSKCPACGTEMEHRKKIHVSVPAEGDR